MANALQVERAFSLGRQCERQRNEEVTESNAARTVRPGPHHESRAKGFPHGTGTVLARFDGNVETRHIAKPDYAGRTLGT
jgi:hypothetical protein